MSALFATISSQIWSLIFWNINPPLILIISFLYFHFTLQIVFLLQTFGIKRWSLQPGIFLYVIRPFGLCFNLKAQVSNYLQIKKRVLLRITPIFNYDFIWRSIWYFLIKNDVIQYKVYSIHFIIGKLQCMLACNWLFVMYDVIFY